ncbi:MAG: ribonuclease HI [Parvularculaceae bacterium]
MMIEVFTDGACLGNPGPGGWGVLIIDSGKRRELNGGEADTTNNRMEMLAAIRALEETPASAKVALHTDSQYVKNGITEWIKGWKKNGWKTSAGKPVKNKDLWLALDSLIVDRHVEWHWVKGHNGHPENERVDELAREAALKFA